MLTGACVYGALIFNLQGCHIIFMAFWVLWFSKTRMCARVWGNARVPVFLGKCAATTSQWELACKVEARVSCEALRLRN